MFFALGDSKGYGKKNAAGYCCAYSSFGQNLFMCCIALQTGIVPHVLDSKTLK